MELKFTTTGKKVEKANWLLSQAIEAAKHSEEYRELKGITLKELDEIESFRKQMCKGYFKKFKNK